MKRTYEAVIAEHFAYNRQMLFPVGPRQVGKTTTSLEVSIPKPAHFYFNWDVLRDRQKIVLGQHAIAADLGLESMPILGVPKVKPFIVFDELHKYSKWKTFLKGFYDLHAQQTQLLVTGSARLDVYKSGGDSLMGRYFLHRLHPFSVGEVTNPVLRASEITPPNPILEEQFQSLLNFGGFPEPFLKQSSAFYTKWKKLRMQQLFEEDLRNLTKIQELGQMQVLALILRQQAGELTNFSALANKVNVSVDTIKRWVEILKSFYYCFSIKPWSKNITRSLVKEPKIYLWDWSLLEDKGARNENFIASHLLKAVHFWTDQGLGEYELYFLRDKEKREVDFLIVKNEKPWMLVEVKSSDNSSVSSTLYYYQNQTQAEYAFQVVIDKEYIDRDCFACKVPTVVPAKTFLSQLV